MRFLLLALLFSVLALGNASQVSAQAQTCPDGKREKFYDAKANWVASVWDLTSTVDRRFYYQVTNDPDWGIEPVRAISRFAISTSGLRGRRVTRGTVTFVAAKTNHVLETALIVPSLYNGTGTGLDDVRRVTAAGLNQGIVLGLGASVGSFTQLDRVKGPYVMDLNGTGINALNAALGRRVGTFSIAVEPLHRDQKPEDVAYHVGWFNPPVLAFYHCAAF